MKIKKTVDSIERACERRTQRHVQQHLESLSESHDMERRTHTNNNNNNNERISRALFHVKHAQLR